DVGHLVAQGQVVEELPAVADDQNADEDVQADGLQGGHGEPPVRAECSAGFYHAFTALSTVPTCWVVQNVSPHIR
ncbi:MAG: hypothetical protein ACD_41C00267G0001, partial [uncultured bacterium]